MVTIDFKGSLRGAKGYKKFRRVKYLLTEGRGLTSFKGTLQGIGDDIWDNVLTRYDQASKGTGTGLLRRLFLGQQKNVTVQELGTGQFSVGVGYIPEFDEATMMFALGTGQVYSYWALVEFGWGKRGGGPEEYILFYKGHKGEPPVRIEGESKEELRPVYHPGYKGVFGFLTKSGAMHIADIRIIPDRLRAFAEVIKRIGNE